MSRVGNKIIEIPEGVSATISGSTFHAAGPKGEKDFSLPSGISATVIDGRIKVSRKDDTKTARSLHGTSARVITNIVAGLKDGFERRLDYKGVGFTVVTDAGKLTMRLGFSHPVILEIPQGVNVSVVKSSIIVEGADKESVGAFAAKIRDTKKPEVYKGKGIKYHEEIIKKKAGKTAQSAAA